MTCPAFGSTSQTSLWYAVDPDPAAAIPSTFTWREVPYTSSSLNATLSSSVSERIMPQRSYSGSLLTSGEVGGDIGFELQAVPFVHNMLVSVLQADQGFSYDNSELAASAAVISAKGTLIDDDRTVTLTGVTAQIDATYSVVINGENFNFVAAAATIDSIATGLAAAIDASSAYAATATTGVITISAGAGLATIDFQAWGAVSWEPDEVIKNGSTKKCLAFLTRIQKTDTTYDWFVLRGCQIGTMTLSMSSGELINGTITVMGTKPDEAVTDATLPVDWTFSNSAAAPLMSGADSLKTFTINNSSGVDTGAVSQDITLTLDNQLRVQQAVGLGHPFAAGVASGRFMATISSTVYYASPQIYNDFLNDNELSIVMDVRDPDNDGWIFNMGPVKVTTGSLPEIGGPDQDLTISTEFQAFESDVAGNLGTVRITRKNA